MYTWLLILIAYLPFQIALNPNPNFDLASLRVFIVLFFIIWFIKSLVNKNLIKNLKFLINLQSVSLLLFLILVSFSLIGAENAFWGLRKIVFFLCIFPLYLLTVILVSKFNKFTQRIKRIISILVKGSGIIALIGLGQFLAQFIFSFEKVYSFWAWQIIPVFSGFNFGALLLSYSSWLVNVNNQTILRAFSLFSDPHMLSFYLGLILPLALVLILWQKNKKRQIIFLLIWLLLFLVSLLSFTRGAYFALIVTFLILAGLLWRYLKLRKAAFLVSLSLLIFIVPITPFADRFYSSFDMADGSNMGRLEMWQQAGQAGLENPWQGVGLGNYSLLVDADLGYRNPVSAHNLYLDLFSESGIFALMVWLILLSGSIWQLFFRIKYAQKKKLALVEIGLLGSLVYFSAHSFFETAIFHPTTLAVLMVILGLIAVINSKERLDD